MADLSGLSANAHPFIPELYCECRQLFEKFANGLREEGCLRTLAKSIDVALLLELYSTFLTWGEKLKVDYPAETEGSLNYKLRHRRASREMTEDLLNGLKTLFRKAVDHLNVLNESVQFLIDVEKAAGGEEGKFRMPGLREIGPLFTALRRGVKVTVAIFSIQRQLELLFKAHKLPRDERDEMEMYEAYLTPYLDQVVEMVRQWRHEALAEKDLKCDKAPGSDSVDDIMWFCKRLALANMKRKMEFPKQTDPLFLPQSDIIEIDHSSMTDWERVQEWMLREPLSASKRLQSVHPYVCTFKDCPTAGLYYSEQGSWKGHEEVKHRMVYVCHKCPGVTTRSREMVKAHLLTHCTGNRVDSAKEIEANLRFCYRSEDMNTSDKKDTCLICLKESPLPDLYKHLAGHMEEITRLVLPSCETDYKGTCIFCRKEFPREGLANHVVSHLDGTAISS
ncbi:hypothetical protein P170DRAFT_474487 [Aspergillus steynii IBT 23096]|uniref:C2H2-type domain-containing protein n=1 Tax=Aspergillus steynii IBT 23096 TaxID=1392250 RepID=A0A2I2GDG9_9EURO|nr:uncharacterized protein P170DRAFT_474487 [Aspergillus steynii IBT 23096]PLB50939.1 hypothetical protein P170DRAFT_474487 [Aspergillus steynii IBT 23096]